MRKRNLALIRVNSPTESRLHMVDRDQFVIGRSPESDIVVNANSISRKHVQIEVRDQKILIEDLESSNGTFLNEMRLEARKKYPIPENTAVRLGNSKETISIELMERPIEFDQYHSYLPKFNQDLLDVMDIMLRDAQSRVDQVLKKADLEAQEIIEKGRTQAQSEGDAIRGKVRAEAEAIAAKHLEKAREEIQKQYNQAASQVQDRAFRDVHAEAERTRHRLREQAHEMKVQLQLEADQILQNAHKESSRLKEEALQEFEKQRLDGQTRAQQILDDAEAEAAKILQHAREASERMRTVARQDFDEAMERIKSQTSDMLRAAEEKSAETIESAKKRAQVIVENQEKESATILSDLSQRIQHEAQKEAQVLVKKAQAEIEETRIRAQEAVALLDQDKRELEQKLLELHQEKAQQLSLKSVLQGEIETLEGMRSQLKEESTKLSGTVAHLKSLEEQVKALELQRIHMQEKNAQVMQDLELLKRNTFEELERVRSAEERKLMNLAGLKAKEFSSRIEKVLVGEIKRQLNSQLSATHLAEISRKLNEEIVAMFASESFKLEEKKALKVQENSPAPLRTSALRWGLALLVLGGLGYLIQNSHLIVKRQNEFTNNLIEKQKDDIQFKPHMTSEYRSTYTDNVLYMDRYLELKNDSHAQDQWALNLNEFFMTELKLSEEKMVRFIGIESALIKRLATLRESVDLRYFEEGIRRMREAETESTTKIQSLLGTAEHYNRLRLREKLFLSQVSASVPVRLPAQKEQAPQETQMMAPQVPSQVPQIQESASVTSTTLSKPSAVEKRQKAESNKRRPHPYR